MPYHSEFLTKDKTGLEFINPPTLDYQRDLNLRLRISYSFARSCADLTKLIMCTYNPAFTFISTCSQLDWTNCDDLKAEPWLKYWTVVSFCSGIFTRAYQRSRIFNLEILTKSLATHKYLSNQLIWFIKSMVSWLSGGKLQISELIKSSVWNYHTSQCGIIRNILLSGKV